MAVTIATWAVHAENPFVKTYDCTDDEDNPILIYGRPHRVGLGVTNCGNIGNGFGPLTGEEDLVQIDTDEDGIEENTGWSVIQTVLEANGVTFSAEAQAEIDAHLASLAYPPDAVQAWSTAGVDDSVLARMR